MDYDRKDIKLLSRKRGTSSELQLAMPSSGLDRSKAATSASMSSKVL
jgi:hypothetical protein